MINHDLKLEKKISHCDIVTTTLIHAKRS